MTTDIAIRENGFSGEQMDLIRRTIAKDANDDELALLLYTARSRGLDPLLRQIHGVSRYDKQANRKVMTIQVGIDGYRLIADRTGAYAGSDDAEFGYDADAPTIEGKLSPSYARVTVWKIVQGQRCPFTATARWSEFYPGEQQGFMWRKMPHTMLAKCAEAQALRKAFPAELGGIYTHEEMHQAGASTVDTITGEIIEQPQQSHIKGGKCTECDETIDPQAVYVVKGHDVPGEQLIRVGMQRCGQVRCGLHLPEKQAAKAAD